MNDKCTVAVLRGNAGAGGAMFAAACDISVAHPVNFMILCYQTSVLNRSNRVDKLLIYIEHNV